MSDEAQIVNRIVVQGINEAKAQVQSLKQMLLETKGAFEQARRSGDQQGIFQGSTKSAEELKRLINEIQAQIKRLNTEISQGDVGTREKALNEELKIRQRIAQQAEQQSARELADQQSLVEQMAKARETSMDRTAAREKSMNDAQVARMNSSVEQEIQARQKVLDYESKTRQKIAKAEEEAAAKQAVLDSIGTTGSQASYAKQMSTLSANIEESYRAFQRGAIGSTEYTAALDKYTKGMSVAKAEQEAFSKSIGTYTSSWDAMRKRVESHASWILAGGAIATALAIPTETINQLKEADALLAKITQNLELAPRYQGNTSGLKEDVKNLEDVAGVFSMAYGQNLRDTMEMMQILSRRFKSPEEITYFTNLAMTMAKLDFVKPQKAAEDLEATILSMGLNFEQSKRFIDEFSVAVHVARINGTDLLTGLQRSAATFHNMNFNTAEAIAMISTLSTVTAKAGANIGTSLNSILINVDFKKAAEALKAYGVAVYDSTGQMRDGVEIWREIATVFNSLDTEHANQFANAISGGKFRANDLRALIGNWQTFEQILEQVNTKASPELTASLLKTGMNTLATNILQAQAALQVLGVTIGEQALPQLKEMTIGLATGVQWLNDNKEAVGQTVSAIGKFVEALVLYKGVQLLSNSALGGFVETLGLEIRTAPSFSAAISSMGSAMAGFASTVGLAALRMGAFYAAARMIGELMDSSKQDENEQKFRESISGKENLSDIEQQTLDALNERDQYVQDKASTTFDTPWGKAAVWLGTSDSESDSVEKEQKFNELNDKTRELLSQSVESSAMEKVNKMVQEAQDELAKNLAQNPPPLPTIPGVDLGATGGTGGTGPNTFPADTSYQIQKKLENYTVKSIEDQAAIAQDAYKSRLDAITDATNRYGKSYAFLDQTIGAMNKHVKELKNTSAQLDEQLTASMGKINELASETGATIEVAGGANTSNAEGSTWYRETSDVNIEGLKSQAIDAISAVSQKFYELTGQQMVVSSGYRDWGGHTDATKFDVVDSASSTLLEQNANGIRDAIISYAQGIGLQVIDEYTNPSANATAGHLDFEAAGFYGGTSGSRQVTVSGLNDVLAGAGVSTESWKGMSAESKKQFISDHKDQVRDANLLIGYLNTISGIEKKRAGIEKEIAKTVKDEYAARIKGIKEVEEYQQKLADQAKRSHLALLGYYATDADKAIAEQVATQQKLAASNAALEYAKKHGVNIFTDQTMSEERVKNLELQAQVEQQSTFGTPEARYKQRLAEIEYQHKLSQALIEGDQTSPMNTQTKLMSNIDAANDKVKALKDLLNDMRHSGNPFVEQTEEFKKYNLELKEAQKNAKELAETYSTKMLQGAYDVTNELILQGKKLSDIWGNLWKQLADDALKALMRIPNESPGLLAQALGIFGGGKKQSSGGNEQSMATALVPLANMWGSGSSYKDPYGYNFGTVAQGSLGFFSGGNRQVQQQKTQPSGTAWGSILGSLVGLFHANGGVVDTPSIAGEDGEEVIIPTQKNTQNSKSLLGYAAGKLGVSSGGLTADFSSKDIAKTAMNISVSSATNMAKTNAILATQNQILTTMLNNMGQQQGQTNVIIAGSGDTSMESQASAYSTLVSRRYITK